MQFTKAKFNKITVGLLLAALALLTLAQPAWANDPVQFKGKEVFVDNTPLSFTFPFASNLTTAEGRLTHFGHYTLIGVTVIDVTTATATGILRMTVANGDILFVTVTGHALQPFSLKQTVAIFTITGGTGRFEGATGSWTTDSFFVNAVNAGVSPNPYVGVLKGSISLRGCDHGDED
jgi:hypothetical protein